MSVRGRSRERLGIEGMANHARYHHHRHVAASLLAWPLDHAGGWRRVDDDWLCIGGACSCGLGIVVGTASGDGCAIRRAMINRTARCCIKNNMAKG